MENTFPQIKPKYQSLPMQFIMVHRYLKELELIGMMKIFLFPALWRAAISRTWSRSSLPGYSYALALPDDRKALTRTLTLAKEGKLAAVLDSQKPYPFTTDGVRKAYRVQEITTYAVLKAIGVRRQ